MRHQGSLAKVLHKAPDTDNLAKTVTKTRGLNSEELNYWDVLQVRK